MSSKHTNGLMALAEGRRGGSPEEDLEAFLAKLEGLPPFPESVPRFQKAFADPDLSLQALAGLVQEDPAVTARVLKVAGSSFYATRSHIQTVDQALVRLGLSEAQRVILASLLGPAMRARSDERSRTYWLHSLAVAFTMEGVARRAAGTTETAPGLLFLVGLLHDLGVLVLRLYDPEGFEALCLEADEQEDTLVEDLERERWGTDHAEVGARLGERWKLAPEIVASLAYHHSPWEAPPEHQRVVEIVHIADFACENHGFVPHGVRPRATFDEGAWVSLGLTPAAIPEIIAETRAQGSRSEVFLSLL
jgi:HD-like signal output (HDOD) protein